MKTFIVDSTIPRSQTDAIDWAQALPRLLKEKGTKDVRFKTAYCCTPDRKVIAEFEGPDKETVQKALDTIEMPFTAVMEATKVHSV